MSREAALRHPGEYFDRETERAVSKRLPKQVGRQI